jgi:regulator of nucleoside diphosphate kinase
MVENHIIVTDADLDRLRPLLEHANTTAADLLDSELINATIIDQFHVPDDVVTMNSEVVYEDLDSSVRRTVRIVYPSDADSKRGWVSVLAPIGSALLGLRVGQETEWAVPAGKKRVRVVELTYQPEAAGDFHR